MNVIFIAVFLTTFLAILAAFYFGFGALSSMRRSGMVKSLKQDEYSDQPEESRPALIVLLDDPDELRKKSALIKLKIFRKLQDRIDGAGLKWTVESVLMSSVIGLFIGVLVGFFFPFLITREFTMGTLGILGVLFPFLSMEFKRAKRMSAFEEQLPEALDFISRAVRAGHAFSVSLEMLAAESPDPIRTEFRRVFNEVNLGSTLDASLKGLAQRIPLIDVRFFVSAVLLQRETGGNLSEILIKLSHTIRERFRLKGQIKALTAHGRITAGVLSALPIIVVLLLSIISPGYLKVFVENPTGRLLAMIALAAQVLAYIVIRKMIDIKV